MKLLKALEIHFAIGVNEIVITIIPIIMKGKFALYYDFIEEENLIVIKFFRSTKQKPLE